MNKLKPKGLIYKGTVVCPSCGKPRKLETLNKELLKPEKAPKCFQCFMDSK